MTLESQLMHSEFCGDDSSSLFPLLKDAYLQTEQVRSRLPRLGKRANMSAVVYL